MVFKRWDVVKIPFAVAGTPEYRPALVIVAGDMLRQHGLLWVVMITSQRNKGWPGDVEITDTIGAGLGVPSVIRTAKIMTVEARSAALIGALIGEQRREVGERVFAAMGLAGALLPA
jgi:mRNA interferase MazF